MAEKGVSSRRIALETLLRIENEGAYANIALSKALERSDLSVRDRALVTHIVQGVIRHRSNLDSRLRPFSKKPLDKIPSVLLNTLRIGVYQLEYLEDIPPSAVLNTCTSIARSCGHEGLAKYSNAVLRSYLRKREESLVLASATLQPDKNLGVNELSEYYSMPAWMIERWRQNLGTETTLAILNESQTEPKVFIRVNRTAISPEGLQVILARAGVELAQSSVVEGVFQILSRGRGRLEELPGYKEGLFSIQDEAASLVSEIVNPDPDTTVIDLCAAPGGKSLHLAEMLEGKGKVIAVDIYEKRLTELKKNRARLSLSNIEISTGDGREFKFDRLADSVLVDAPCSGTGVLNRRSDLKYRKKPEDLKELPVLQEALLNNAATLVKPGGVLVYSTCSLEPEENQAVIESFLKKWGESFKPEDLTPYLPESLKNDDRLSDTAKAGMLLLHPGIRGLSGFFIARLRRAPDEEMQ